MAVCTSPAAAAKARSILATSVMLVTSLIVPTAEGSAVAAAGTGVAAGACTALVKMSTAFSTLPLATARAATLCSAVKPMSINVCTPGSGVNVGADS